MAKAEADANRIQAESQIEITDLQKRALRRFVGEEGIKQSNMEAITRDAIPLLEDQSKPQNVEDDWIAAFFDKCRIVSDSDMQKLWAKVLAREVNTPGAISRRTLSLLADLEKTDAELFKRLCGFRWTIQEDIPVVLDVQHNIYNRENIGFSSLSHLESRGLIQFGNLAGFVRLKLPKTVTVSYFSRIVTLTFQLEADNPLEIGKVRFTRAGDELSRICGAEPVEGFFEYVYDVWAAKTLVPKRDIEQDAPGSAPKVGQL